MEIRTLKHYFAEWFCQQIQEIEWPDATRAIIFPFRPLGDDQVTVYIRQVNGEIRITDDQETLSHLFVNYGLDATELNNEQKNFIEHVRKIHAVEFDGKEFYLRSSGDLKTQFKQILRLLQTIVPMYYTVALYEKQKAASFARRVYNFLAEKCPTIRPSSMFQFSGVRRECDFYIEKDHSIPAVGRSIYQRRAIDTTVTTWDYIDLATNGDIESDHFKIGTDVLKVVVYSDLLNVELINILQKKGFVFPYARIQEAREILCAL